MSYAIVGNKVLTPTGKVVDKGSDHSDAVRSAEDRAKKTRGRSSVTVPELPKEKPKRRKARVKKTAAKETGARSIPKSKPE